MFSTDFHRCILDIIACHRTFFFKINYVLEVIFLKLLLILETESNKILNMNGRLFENLPALDWVDLRDNACINGLFETPESIETLSRNVTESCAFTDTGEIGFEKVVNTECGVIKYGTGFILGGTETKPGQW